MQIAPFSDIFSAQLIAGDRSLQCTLLSIKGSAWLITNILLVKIRPIDFEGSNLLCNLEENRHGMINTFRV